MSETERKYDAESHLKTRISLLFPKYTEHNPSDDLEVISDYFKYLAEHINHRRLRVDGAEELVSTFESVFLLLEQHLLLYPETIRKQVTEILAESKVSGTLAIIVNVPSEEIFGARLVEQFGVILGRLLSAFIFMGRSLDLSTDNYGLTQKNLFKAKLALSRLSQILKYAATIKLVDYDVAFHDLKDHYDPDLIQKSKLIALVNILRVQVDILPDKEIAGRIITRLERLEEEIRKPSPRWGVIIAGALALLGFLADLKQLDPEIYTNSYQRASQIVAVLFQDGSVSATKADNPLLAFGNNGGNGGKQENPFEQKDIDATAALPSGKEDDEKKK